MEPVLQLILGSESRYEGVFRVSKEFLMFPPVKRKQQKREKIFTLIMLLLEEGGSGLITKDETRDREKIQDFCNGLLDN